MKTHQLGCSLDRVIANFDTLSVEQIILRSFLSALASGGGGFRMMDHSVWVVLENKPAISVELIGKA